MTTYDKVDWHFDAKDFPQGHPRESAAKHFAYFFRWAAERDLVSDLHRVEHAKELARVLSGKLSAATYLLQVADGRLIDEDFTAEGRRVAKACYTPYLKEYEKAFVKIAKPTYAVPDSDDAYRIATMLATKVHAEWLNQKAPATTAKPAVASKKTAKAKPATARKSRAARKRATPKKTAKAKKTRRTSR